MNNKNIEKYDESILKYAIYLGATAIQIEEILGSKASAVATLGAILEESNDRGLLDDEKDHYALKRSLIHEDILAEYNDIKSNWSMEGRVNSGNINKLLNPVLIDIGTGNFELYTAIDLLEEYNQRFPDLDPLALKKYNDDYVKLSQDLASNWWGDTTVKFAALMVEQGMNWGEKYASNWDDLTAEEKEGFAVYFYNIGRGKAYMKYGEESDKYGKYEIDINNTDIAQEYLMNRPSILENMTKLLPITNAHEITMAEHDNVNAGCVLIPAVPHTSTMYHLPIDQPDCPTR